MKEKVIGLFIFWLMIVITLPVTGEIEIYKQNIQNIENNQFDNRTLTFQINRWDNDTQQYKGVGNVEIWLWLYYSSKWSIPFLIGLTNDEGAYPYNDNYSGYPVPIGMDIKILAIHGWYGSWEFGPHTVNTNDPQPFHFDVVLNPKKNKPINEEFRSKEYAMILFLGDFDLVEGKLEGQISFGIIFGNIGNKLQLVVVRDESILGYKEQFRFAILTSKIIIGFINTETLLVY